MEYYFSYWVTWSPGDRKTKAPSFLKHRGHLLVAMWAVDNLSCRGELLATVHENTGGVQLQRLKELPNRPWLSTNGSSLLVK